jgi:DNA-nicking Smr family endonuclease
MTIKDREVWANYTRGVRGRKKGVASTPTAQSQLHKRGHATGDEAEKRLNASLSAAGPHPLPPAREGRRSLSVSLLERAREKKLRQGEFTIDAKLDLHGMTQVEAFAALSVFMHKKAAAGKRHLLIITGKGRGGEGVLRRNLEKWLSQLPEAGRVLALRPAAIKHGGDGAFYVVLRKS